MPFTTPDLDTIRAAILRDISNLLPEADTGNDSDFSVRASAVSSAIEGLYEYQAWMVKQIFPDTADSDMLALHARTRGLSKKQAVAAGGQVQLLGTPGYTALAGVIALRADGAQFQTTVDATVAADGTITVNAVAVVAGSAGNTPAGTALTLASPPQGFVSSASVVSMVGGTDIETDDDLLARLLDVIQRPPAGGNQYDYRRWAMNVSGVTAAYVYPLRRGLGTVDIVITASGGLPSADTIAAVQAYIDAVRPVTAKNALVLAPTLLNVDLAIGVALTGTTLPIMTPIIQSAIAGYFAGLAPGDTFVKSRAEAVVSDLVGVNDRLISAPAGNVVPEVDATVIQWCQMGNVAVTPL